MTYIELEILIPENTETGRDISVAQLGELGFEAFEEIPGGLRAYIRESDYDPGVTDALIVSGDRGYGMVTHRATAIGERNWNAEWEAGFQPVAVDDFCYVRSTFHPPSAGHRHDIVIDPKMSFGTGHHSTTELMVRRMAGISFTGREVLDMGCGTAILSILASRLGAGRVTGVDIDEWAFRNSIENLAANSVENCEILHGDIKLVIDRSFDIILANITRNILVADMAGYSRMCRSGGTLLLSGFYREDLDTIKKSAADNSFLFNDFSESNRWVSAQFIKE